MSIHRPPQFLQADWFRQIIHRSQLHGLQVARDVEAMRHDHDGQMPVDLVGAFQNAAPFEVWASLAYDDEIERFGVQEVDRFFI